MIEPFQILQDNTSKTYNIRYSFKEGMENNLVTYLENVGNYDYIMTLHLSLDISLQNTFTFADVLLEALALTKNLQKIEIINSTIQYKFFRKWLKQLGDNKVYYSLVFLNSANSTTLI